MLQIRPAPGHDLLIHLQGGQGTQTLYLGTSPSYQSIHARAGKSDEVYLLRDLALWEVPAEASGWWQSSILDQDPKQLLAVELVNQQGSLKLQRSALTEPWLLSASQTAPDPQKTEDFLAGLSRVAINEVVADPAWRPKGTPVATLKLKSGEREEELQVWPRPDENSDYPVKLAGSEFYAKAGSYAVQGLLNAKPEILLPSQEQKESAPEKALGTST